MLMKSRIFSKQHYFLNIQVYDHLKHFEKSPKSKEQTKIDMKYWTKPFS